MPAPYPDMPAETPEWASRLEETHHVVQFAPNDDPALAYRITVPRDWTVEGELDLLPDELDLGEPYTIGLFAPFAGPDAPSVALTMARLPLAVDIGDWLEELFGELGWEVFARQWFEHPSGALACDLGAVRGSPREVLRAMAWADGGRLFVASGTAPEAVWDQWKEHFLVVCAHAQLLEPTDPDGLEGLLEFRSADTDDGADEDADPGHVEVVELKDDAPEPGDDGDAAAADDQPPAFALVFPESWELEPRHEGDERGRRGVRLTLADDEGNAVASIVVTPEPPGRGREELLAAAQQDGIEEGFAARRPAAPDPDTYGEQVEEDQATLVAPGEWGEWDAAELRVGARRLEQLSIRVAALGPARTHDSLTWMRVKCLVGMVLDHVGVPSDFDHDHGDDEDEDEEEGFEYGDDEEGGEEDFDLEVEGGKPKKS